jgi:hypothetical protein
MYEILPVIFIINANPAMIATISIVFLKIKYIYIYSNTYIIFIKIFQKIFIYI